MNTIQERSQCIRCGTCCKKGGPCFHHEDKFLIEQGKILSKYLYTIRQGEMAYDNVKGCLTHADTDIIKIKSADNSRTCVFFDIQAGCTIYDNKPVECSALKCWDTRDIEKIYSKNRLTRKDVLEPVKGLWELIQDHHIKCDYKKIKELIKNILEPDKKSDKDNTQENFTRILQYDNHIRSLLVSQGKIQSDMLDFLFGRPLIETVRAFGVNITKKGERFYVKLSKTNL